MSVQVSGSCDQGGQCTLYGRLTAKDATGTVVKAGEAKCLKQADIATLWFTIVSLTDTPIRIIIPVSPMDKTKVIFDGIQTAANDPGYVGDGLGFNFRFTIVPGILLAPSRQYRASVRAVTTGGGVGNGIWNIGTIPVDIGNQTGDPPPCEQLPYE
jgi:hypothetical protein